MHLVMNTGLAEGGGAGSVESTPERGLVGWLWEMWLGLMERGRDRQVRKQMRVIETLAIGGKKQLVLVSCAGERFLVGTGADSVQTIVRVRPEAAARESGAAKSIGDGC